MFCVRGNVFFREFAAEGAVVAGGAGPGVRGGDEPTFTAGSGASISPDGCEM